MENDYEPNLHEFIMFCCKSLSNRLGSLRQEMSKQCASIRLNNPFSGITDLGNIPLEESSSCSDFFGEHRGGTKFLGKLSTRAIHKIISQSKINSILKSKGFQDWYVELDLSDSFCHYLYLRSQRFPLKDQYIGFLIARNSLYRIKAQYHSDKMMGFLKKNLNVSQLNMLDIQWLSLQNPSAKFSQTRPKLPGQRYPGSGIGRHVFDILKQQCYEHQKDGISNVPEYFHNAFLYEGFRFLDPEQDAMFSKMKIDLWNEIHEYSLSEVSWAIAAGCLLMDGNPVRWIPGEFVLPISFRMRTYFYTASYLFAINDANKRLGLFTIDWNKFKAIGV